MLDRLEIKNGAQDTNFQLCRLHIDLFHDDFWSGINNGSFLKKIKIMRGRPQGIVGALIDVHVPRNSLQSVETTMGSDN